MLMLSSIFFFFCYLSFQGIVDNFVNFINFVNFELSDNFFYFFNFANSERSDNFRKLNRLTYRYL